MTNDYEIITGDEAVQIRESPKRGRGLPSSALSRLIAGEVVWVPKRSTFGGHRQYLKQKGLSLRTKIGVRGGISGTYLWTEPLGEADS